MAWMYNVDAYLQVRMTVMVDGMSIREASRVFGLHWDTVRKVLAFSDYQLHSGYGTQPHLFQTCPPKAPQATPLTII